MSYLFSSRGKWKWLTLIMCSVQNSKNVNEYDKTPRQSTMAKTLQV